MRSLKNQKGQIKTLAIYLVLSLVVWAVTLGFAIWAYLGRQDLKNNINKKATDIANTAIEKVKKDKDAEFAQREKEPLKAYKGPAAFGSIVIKFPKTWSAFVSETNTGSQPIDGKFHPDFVPAEQAGTVFALRVQVKSTSYDNELKQFDSLAKGGQVKVTPFRAASVPGVLGARIDGEIMSQKRGTMILLPLRDKTLKIWTESGQFVEDLNNLVLPSLSFVP